MICTQCQEPIEEHHEGRETDKCVAEKLGWIMYRGTPDHPYAWPPDSHKSRYHPDDWCVREIPYYTSTDSMDSAWGLVEKLDKGVFAIVRNADDTWCVWAGDSSATPQLAICRAFLVAV